MLERMRAIKTPDELAKLKIASDAVLDSMKAVIANHGPGATKAELSEALRREETNRGLTFEYCLITAGTSLNRAPSDQVWGEGDILSLDSGGNYHGYIGDICRMAIQGEPDAELEDMLGDIEAIQRASMKPIKAGAMGSEVYARRPRALSPSRSTTTTCTSSATAWAWSATRRRASPPPGRCPTTTTTPSVRSRPAW